MSGQAEFNSGLKKGLKSEDFREDALIFAGMAFFPQILRLEYPTRYERDSADLISNCVVLIHII